MRRTVRQGKLLELNERLRGEPALLAAAPCGAGFLAIVMPRPEELQQLRASAAAVVKPLANH